MPVRRAEGFFLVLGEVQQRERTMRLEDADSFLEGEVRVGRVVEHLAHQHEVGKVFGEPGLRHFGDFRAHVGNAFLGERRLQPANHLGVAVDGGHVLAASGHHEREVATFAAADIHDVLERVHEFGEQAYLRLEAPARLVELVDLPLGLVGAVFQYLGGTALDNIFVWQRFAGIPDDRKYSATQVEVVA